MIFGDETVNTQSRVILGNLLGLDLGQSSDWVEAGIFGQGQRDGLQGIGEATESVLLDRLDLNVKDMFFRVL